MKLMDVKPEGAVMLPALFTKRQVAEWAGCSQRQIELLTANDKFPKPIRLGSHPRWRRSDLLNWLDSQGGAR